MMLERNELHFCVGDGVGSWFDTPDLGRGSYKKARGSILISYIDVLSESIANLQYRIS